VACNQSLDRPDNSFLEKMMTFNDYPEIIRNASGLDLMLMLDRLHGMGYEKLRWLSYISPNGLALRCHITTAENIVSNREVIKWDDNLFAISVRSFKEKSDIDEMARAFLDSFPRLAMAGKGKDPRYRFWFTELLARAKKGAAPKYYGDFWDAPLGFIKAGQEIFPAPPGNIRLISWNIDGLKARWPVLQNLIAGYSPDVICLQKVRHSGEVLDIDGYKCFMSSAPYAGVCTYIRNNIPHEPDSAIQEIPTATGYMQKFKILYPDFTLFNCYVPYSNPDVAGAVEHRENYDRFLLQQVRKTSDRLVICGDMNIVHSSLDCWDGKHERDQANFHDWERQNFEHLLSEGNLADTFRELHRRDKRFSYFFRNDPKVRADNQGHRIDYFLASKSFIPYISEAEIIKDVTASTNNPILLAIDY